jgi:hypothetical protein
VSSAPRLFFVRGKSPQYPLDRGLFGLQIRKRDDVYWKDCKIDGNPHLIEPVIQSRFKQNAKTI